MERFSSEAHILASREHAVCIRRQFWLVTQKSEVLFRVKFSMEECLLIHDIAILTLILQIVIRWAGFHTGQTDLHSG